MKSPMDFFTKKKCCIFSKKNTHSKAVKRSQLFTLITNDKIHKIYAIYDNVRYGGNFLKQNSTIFYINSIFKFRGSGNLLRGYFTHAKIPVR